MANNTAIQILVIDDEIEIGKLVTTAAQTIDINCTATTNVDSFLAAINPNIRLILLDLMMPEIDGVELLRKLGQQQCKSRIILMSGVDKRVLQGAQDMAHSLGLSVVGILQKPFRLAELKQMLITNTSLDIATKTSINAPTSVIQAPLKEITQEELQLGIERKEFILYYQPQIEIATNKMVGLEALVRWQHPELGLIFPDYFINKAEELELIDQLGWLVAEKALNDIKQFVNKDGTTPTISINVSPYSLQDLQFPDKFIALVNRSNMNPENVILEVTESGLFKELSSALDILTRLRMKKCKISIDDFGTGYAMIQQLQHVPATELKVDKSIVQDMQKESTCIMIRKIIEMGHDLGLQIVAEGVDTAEQLEFLRVNKCDIAQGYFFSNPKPTRELLDWISKREM